VLSSEREPPTPSHEGLTALPCHPDGEAPPRSRWRGGGALWLAYLREAGLGWGRPRCAERGRPPSGEAPEPGAVVGAPSLVPQAGGAGEPWAAAQGQGALRFAARAGQAAAAVAVARAVASVGPLRRGVVGAE